MMVLTEHDLTGAARAAAEVHCTIELAMDPDDGRLRFKVSCEDGMGAFKDLHAALGYLHQLKAIR